MNTRREKALYIVRTLRKKGYDAYFVGGCVRDKLLGDSVKDYDIATSALPEEIEESFHHCLDVGAKFGVMIVILGRNQYEVTTFRAEYGYDGRRPSKVQFTTAEEDVHRRDFTINGILYDPIDDRYFDYVGGKEDLEKEVIRAIGDPRERFFEDRLRMLRAIRFSCTLDFAIEEHTHQAIVELAPGITEISGERIRNEFVRILTSDHPHQGVEKLIETGLMNHIAPGFQSLWEKKEEKEGLLRRLKKAVGKGKIPLVALFFLPSSPEKVYDFLHDKLRFSNEICDIVRDILITHPLLLKARDLRLSRLKRILRKKDISFHLKVLDVEDPDGAEFLRQQLEHYRHREEQLFPPRLITGHDLGKMGYDPGPIYSKILRGLEDAQLEEKVYTKKEARIWIKENFPQPPSN